MSTERLAFGSTRRSVTRAEKAPPGKAISRPATREPAASRRASREIASSSSATAAREPRDWAFTWMLLFTGALFLRPQDLIPPLQILHLPELTAIAGLSSLFSQRLRRHQPFTRVTPELIGVVLLGAIMLLTAPFSIWVGGAVRVFIEMYSKVILIYLLAVNVVSSPRRLERFTWVLVLSISYVAMLGVVDFVRGVDTIGHGTRVRGAVGGVLQNPNDLALNLVSFLPLAAFTIIRPGSIVKRGVAACCVLLMVATLVATGSRGGFLGFVAMALVLASFAVRRRPAFVIAAALAALCALPLVPQNYWVRLASITDQSLDATGSAQARRELIKESYRAFLENPITGVGAGQFVNWDPEHREQAAHEAHDVLLQVASEMGVAGLAAFVYLIGRAFISVYQTRQLIRQTRRRRRSRDQLGAAATDADSLDDADLELLDAHSAAMTAAVTGWLVCALFGSVAYNWTFYYLLLLAATPREMLRDLLPARQPRRRRTSALEVARA